MFFYREILYCFFLYGTKFWFVNFLKLFEVAIYKDLSNKNKQLIAQYIFYLNFLYKKLFGFFNFVLH